MRRDALLLEDIVAAADAVAEFIQMSASFDWARIMAAQSRERELVVASAYRLGKVAGSGVLDRLLVAWLQAQFLQLPKEQ